MKLSYEISDGGIEISSCYCGTHEHRAERNKNSKNETVVID
jgi:hypothetical protein